MHIDRQMNLDSVAVCNGQNGRWKIVKMMSLCVALAMIHTMAENFVVDLMMAPAYHVHYLFDHTLPIAQLDFDLNIVDACTDLAIRGQLIDSLGRYRFADCPNCRLVAHYEFRSHHHTRTASYYLNICLTACSCYY